MIFAGISLAACLSRMRGVIEFNRCDDADRPKCDQITQTSFSGHFVN
jgi:hypothetical protein